jgi:hypothetical protein
LRGNDFSVTRVIVLRQANHDHIAGAWSAGIANNKHTTNTLGVQAKK